METKTVNIIVGVLAVLAVVFGVGYLKAPKVEVQVNVPEQRIPFGSSPGPDRTHPTESINEVRRHYYSSGLNQASTTICSFKTPAATTTLESGTLKITTGTSTTISVELAKSTSQAATTTRLAYLSSLASGAQVTIDAAHTASTTGTYGARGVQRSADEDDKVFAPSAYFNVKYGGAAGSLNVLVGRCKATFLEN